MRRKNILFTAVDIGGRIETYTNYLHSTYGQLIRCESFVKYKVPKDHYKTDYNYYFAFNKQPRIIQWFISLLFFIYALFRYDVIYIISGENILTRKLLKLELWCYKLFRKKVIMHFVGADIRNTAYLKWKDQSFLKIEGIEPQKQTPFQKKLTTLAEKYASKIIVTSPDLIDFFKENKVLYIPVFIDIDKFLQELPSKEKKDHRTVLHAPSNASIKGTKYIEAVFNSLSEKFPNVEFILTTKPQYSNSVQPPYTVTKYRLYELYNQSDIVIDQLTIGWYGMQTIESLLANNITICLIEKKYMKYIDNQSCPITFIHKVGELKETLNQAIQHSTQPNAREWIISTHTIGQNKDFQKVIDWILNECKNKNT